MPTSEVPGMGAKMRTDVEAGDRGNIVLGLEIRLTPLSLTRLP